MTIGTAAIAALVLLFFFKAPLLPTMTGAIGAALFIIRKSWYKRKMKGI
jgi:hypothetical protein